VALTVLDSSVVIALLDGTDPLHQAATEAMLAHAGDDLRLPASAYAECLVGPARRGRLDAARSRIAELQLQTEPLTGAIAERAAKLRARFRSLRLPDAQVIATAEVLAADVILTGDRAWGRASRRTRLVR
jgi:predicted nucleic acid-binding protein